MENEKLQEKKKESLLEKITKDIRKAFVVTMIGGIIALSSGIAMAPTLARFYEQRKEYLVEHPEELTRPYMTRLYTPEKQARSETASYGALWTLGNDILLLASYGLFLKSIYRRKEVKRERSVVEAKPKKFSDGRI